MGGGGSEFLLVEDEAVVARSIARILQPRGATRIVGSVADAIRVLHATSWTALFVDVGLPDGSGFDVIAEARTRDNSVPALVMTGRDDAATANRAFDLGAKLVRKPVESERIRVFLREAIRHGLPAALRRRSVLDDWQEAYALTPSEIGILRDAVKAASEGIIKTQRDLADARSLAPNTIKKHVQNILSKTGDSSLMAAVQRALHER